MARSVCLEKLGRGGSKLEPVPVSVGNERFDQTFVQVASRVDLRTKAEVEVLGESGIVTEANLEGHPAFEHPLARLGRLQPSNDTLEHDAAAEPIQGNAHLCGTVA